MSTYEPAQHPDSGPRVVGEISGLADAVGEADVSGAVWRLEVPERDLDSNVIALPPGGEIAEHDGPDLGVLVHVLAGSGEVTGAAAAVPLGPGTVLWLPRRSRRGFRAGPDGLRYLTVHQHKRGLTPQVRGSD